MNRLRHNAENRAQRAHRVRANVSGTNERPRLSVHVSNRHAIAQIINDETHQTLAYVTTVSSKATGTMSDKMAGLGTDIAKQAKAKKVTNVVFDRGSRLYHGRMSALADAARKGGLEF
jgi:large subunit ribosomal protein L18